MGKPKIATTDEEIKQAFMALKKKVRKAQKEKKQAEATATNIHTGNRHHVDKISNLNAQMNALIAKNKKLSEEIKELKEKSKCDKCDVKKLSELIKKITQ